MPSIFKRKKPESVINRTAGCYLILARSLCSVEKMLKGSKDRDNGG
jgi:hypothetical protein